MHARRRSEVGAWGFRGLGGNLLEIERVSDNRKRWREWRRVIDFHGFRELVLSPTAVD